MNPAYFESLVLIQVIFANINTIYQTIEQQSCLFALLTIGKYILGYGWRSGKMEYHIRRMNDQLDNYQVINLDSRSRKDKTVAYVFK